MNLNDFLEKYANPVTDIEIQTFEEEYKISLPLEVKNILYFSNGCSAKNRFIKMEDDDPEYLIGFFSILEIGAGIRNMKSVEAEFHYYFSDVLLPIGDPGGTRYLCIGINGEYEGKIYIINYQDYDYENLESMIIYIAPSIEDLLNRLMPEYDE
jgi:hypothetical protein